MLCLNVHSTLSHKVNRCILPLYTIRCTMNTISTLTLFGAGTVNVIYRRAIKIFFRGGPVKNTLYISYPLSKQNLAETLTQN